MQGQYPQYKVPRLTKSIAEQYIAMHLGLSPMGINFVKLVESPKTCKHACVPVGVTLLPTRQATYGNTIIEYAVCTACSKVLYYYEDINYY